MVFNRWGMPVYRTNNPTNKWDGTYKTADCPIGNYIYVVNYQFSGQPKKTVKGSLVLVR
jgi:gliding motility-associated-like protein